MVSHVQIDLKQSQKEGQRPLGDLLRVHKHNKADLHWVRGGL